MATSLRLATLLPDGTEKSSVWLRPAVATGLDVIVTHDYDLGYPDVREVTEEYPGFDGINDRSYYTGARTISLNLSVFTRGDTRKEDIISNLRSYVSPKAKPVLYLKAPHWDRERRMVLRGTGAQVGVSKKHVFFQDITLNFTCPRGFIESADQYYEDLRPELNLGTGLNFGPTMTFDPTFNFGDVGAGGQRTVHVEGTEPTPPIFVVSGGCSNPVIRHMEKNQEIAFNNLSVPAGSNLVIDVETQQILLDGIPYYSKFKFESSRFWTLESGENTVKFAPESADATCNLRIYYRDRWV